MTKEEIDAFCGKCDHKRKRGECLLESVCKNCVWNGNDFLRATSFWEAWGEEVTHWMNLPEPPKGE